MSTLCDKCECEITKTCGCTPSKPKDHLACAIHILGLLKKDAKRLTEETGEEARVNAQEGILLAGTQALISIAEDLKRLVKAERGDR